MIPTGPSLPSLPPEIQLGISQHLSYPDALSLKHTSRQFYNLVNTGVRLKVAWLIDRSRSGLECASQGKGLIMKTDETFCASGHVRRIMEGRRRHEECRERTWCVVLMCSESCGYGGRRRDAGLRWRWESWMRMFRKGRGSSTWVVVMMLAVMLVWLGRLWG